MTQLRVIVLGETSTCGKQWLGVMQEKSILEVNAAPDQSSIFEDFERVGEVPVVLLENMIESRVEILTLRKSGFPHYVVWFGANFTKEDYAFAIEQRIYSVLERPEADDEKIASLFQRLQFNAARSSHFNSLTKELKSTLVQLTSSEEQHPLFAELKSATVKLEDLEGQNEFSYPGNGNMNRMENPLLSYSQNDLGDAIESMEDMERTGALWVRGTERGQEGRIEFLQGKIVLAEAGECTSMKAIFRMFLWPEPKFLFARELANEVPFGEERIKYPIDLIAQGRRLRIEFDKIKEELPPPAIKLEINAESVVDKLELNGKNFNVLSSVIEFGRVSEIVDYNALPDTEIFQSLIDLRKLNLIRVAHTG